ncbi:hypothetical protein BaRGS_00036816 [Batillaria attramentaria]|uniref:Secreted protein n=1 Tax=Batillaria attramentaria TaxID=370345 RepID=A0ABD0JBU6_9CAEN
MLARRTIFKSEVLVIAFVSIGERREGQALVGLEDCLDVHLTKKQTVPVDCGSNCEGAVRICQLHLFPRTLIRMYRAGVGS